MISRLLMAALLASLLIGCGSSGEDDSDVVANALGGTRADSAQSRDVFDAVGPLSETQASLVAALRSADVPEAVEAVELMDEQVDAGLRLTRALGPAEPRRTLAGYLGTAKDYVEAAEGLVGYLEDAYAPRKPALERRLLTRLHGAQGALRAADRCLIDRIAESVLEDDRDGLEAALEDVKERQREIVQGGS